MIKVMSQRVMSSEKVLADVLIIEDESLMSALLKRYLEPDPSQPKLPQNLKLECFDSGWDLFEKDLSQVRVAIVDILLPKISGVDLIRHFRKEYPHIGIIPISGMATEPMKRALKDLLPSCLKLLSKPLRREEFMQAFFDAWKLSQLPPSESPLFEHRSKGPSPTKEEDAEPMWTTVSQPEKPRDIAVEYRVTTRKKPEAA